MAYRTAENARWQQMPFILGFTIHLSGNHPVADICDELKGDYPKEFKFVGWHPWCRCFTTSILPKGEEFLNYLAMTDEEQAAYQFKGAVTDVPPAFTKWIDDNQERIKAAKSLPYFIKDNYVNGNIDKGFSFVYKEIKDVAGFVPYSFNTLQQREWIKNCINLEDVCGAQGDAMTHKQADSGAVNPNYWKTKGYRVNCQSCVVAYELRRRGFDVETCERIAGLTHNMNKIAEQTEIVWRHIDTGNLPKLMQVAGKSVDDFKTNLNEVTAEVGRYHVRYMPQMSNGKGHIITLERTKKGSLIIYDPQNNKHFKGIDNFSTFVNMDYKTIIYKVDDTLVNDDILHGVVKIKKAT